MSYESLFDRLNETSQGYWQSMVTSLHYLNATLPHVIDSIKYSLGKDDEKNLLNLIVQSPRIVRAAIDFNIFSTPGVGPNLITGSMDLALDIYRGGYGAENIDSDVERIYELTNGRIKNFLFHQISDPPTWTASHPDRSEETVSNLRTIGSSEDLLFIPLGHGGTMPGMDVFLRYCDSVSSDNSVIYPVRFSNMKKGDGFPKLSRSEICYLRDLSDGRHVVVFDEDSATGATIERAQEFFRSEVFPGKSIISCLNVDKRCGGS